MPSLADQTLQRLRALAEGNGLAPEAFELVKVNENSYQIEGALRLTPSFQVKTRSGFGSVKKNDGKNFDSFAAMKEEIERQKRDFEKNEEWLKTALAEIEKEPGHGWGMEEADITWPDQTVLLSASEPCAACAGKGQTPCPFCEGRGTVLCIHCRGTGYEDCQYCLGRGEDPAHPGAPCPACNGKRFTPCRFCQTTGQMPCEHCAGKATQPCEACRGTGHILHQAKITKGANVHFTLGRTTDLPSGLLRMMDRIGLANLVKGHIDVAMHPPAAEPETPEERATVRLTAQAPFAEIVLKIDGAAHKIFALGKKGRLSNVPAFLDRSLEEARKILLKAAHGTEDIEKAAKLRLLRDALRLALQGKTAPNDLRRLYPVGLSAETASEIAGNMSLALKGITARARLVASIVFAAASATIFAGFFHSPLPALLEETFGKNGLLAVKILLPFLAIGAAWAGLLRAAQGALKAKYPEATIGGGQDLGRRGYTALAAIGLLYALFLFLSA